MDDKTKDDGIKKGNIHKKEIECACCQDGSCGWNPTKPRPKEEETKG